MKLPCIYRIVKIQYTQITDSLQKSIKVKRCNQCLAVYLFISTALRYQNKKPWDTGETAQPYYHYVSFWVGST